MLGWVNKLGGIIFLRSAVHVAWSVILFYLHQLQLIKEKTISESVTWQWIEPWGPWVINKIGTLIPLFKDMFKELEDFFGHIASNAAHAGK